MNILNNSFYGKYYENYCKISGCNISPNVIDGEITIESILRLLDTGRYSISYTFGDPTLPDGSENNIYMHSYYIRTRHKSGGAVGNEIEGECVMYGDNGDHCHLLSISGKCPMLINKHDTDILYPTKQCCIDWFKYNDILEEAYQFVYPFEQMRIASQTSSNSHIISLFLKCISLYSYIDLYKTHKNVKE